MFLLSSCHLFLLIFVRCLGAEEQPTILRVDRSRLELGEAGLKEMEGKAVHSPCWRDAVERLDDSCKQLSDIQQSKLAVAFANCHLAKSGRQTYLCSREMTVRECTETMDAEAYQTYTHFFTHTGHICYFLQIELWQGRTEGLIGGLSHTSSETLNKLEQSLDYHRVMEDKQDRSLQNQDTILEQDRQISASLRQTRKEIETSFGEMSAMAEQQRAMLGDMFGSLQSSVDTVRGLVSVMVVEFVGWSTVAWFCLSWLVVMLLPQFHYSRFKMLVLLIAEGMVEVCVRRIFGYLYIERDTSPPNDLSSLHNMLWLCRYLCASLGLLLYIWEWYSYQDYGERNYKLLHEIRQLMTEAPPPLPHVSIRPESIPKLASYPHEDFTDIPDSTDSTPNDHHHHHHQHHTISHLGLSSDEEEGQRSPDNDRAAAAARTRPISKTVKGHRSFRQPLVVDEGHESLLPPPPPPSHLSDYLSSDDERTFDNSHILTRSPIHSKRSPSPSLISSSTISASQRGARGRNRRRSNTPVREAITSDPEPEKEVVEERDANVPRIGSRRSLRASDAVTGQPVTPTTALEHLPSSTSDRTRHLTPEPSSSQRSSHRYNLRERTPGPHHK